MGPSKGLLRGRIPLVEPYKPYLLERWNEGCRNARQLWRELKERGFTAYYAVERFVAQFRTQEQERKFKPVAPASRPIVLAKKHKPFTALQAARLMTVSPSSRGECHSE